MHSTATKWFSRRL